MANTTTTFVRVINSVEINQVGVVTSIFNIGARGLSSYEQAVAGGYEGTLYQFELDLASIPNKVDKVAGKSLVSDESIAALWQRFAGSCLIPEITDNGNGTITLGAGSFCTYENDLGQGIIKKHEYLGSDFAITAGVMNYIVGDYNAGTPIVRNTSNVTEINEITVVPIYSIFRSGNVLHIQHWDSLASALANKIHKSIIKTQRYRRQEGLTLSAFGTRNLLLSSGIVYVGAVEYFLSEVNSTTDGILQFTQNNLGVWGLTVVNSFNNTQYNTPTGVVELTTNRYAVNWIFRGVENQKHMYSVLGVGDYTLQQAQEAALPSIPINISSHAMLVAKIVIQKNAATATSIRSAFDTSISFAPITEHNNTTGIQGGTAGEYYHLTAAQLNKVNSIVTTHAGLTDKNSEAACKHVDTTTTKNTLDEADKVPLYDSVTGNMVLTPKSNFVEAKPDVWNPLTLLNGWVNVSETDKASFLKDSIGVIHLRGRIKDGAAGAVGFSLPLGFYREGISMEHPLVSGYGAYGRLLIATNGTCYINVDYNVNVDLASISFKL